MNRTKMIHQLDRTFPDKRELKIDASVMRTPEEMNRIAEEFFTECKQIWSRKYDNTYQIDMALFPGIIDNSIHLTAQVIRE